MNKLNARLPLAILLSFLITSSYAATKPDNALIYQDKTTGLYYVQLGMFSLESNANHLKTKIEQKTHFPVTIHHIKNYYLVKAGPLHTAAEANATKEAMTSRTNHSAEMKPIEPVHQAATPLMTPKQNLSNQLIEKPVATPSGNWFVAGYVGREKPNINSSITTDNGSGYPWPNNLDTYSTNENATASAAVEVGYRRTEHRRFIPAYSLSLRYEHIFSNDIGGLVTQYSLPDFTNYSYKWDVSSDVFLILGKVNIVEWHHFLPYISGGIGTALNRTSNYTETALANVTPRVSPGFQNNTNSQFAYHLGAGVDWQIQPQYIVSLGYDYEGLGTIFSGNGEGSWAGNSLSSQTFHSNSVMLGFTYLLKA
jgi:opacity protein-like surface antigen